MRMYEFGKENEKCILLLHGAGCTYKMWTPQIEELEKKYHVYAPSMSGHESGDGDFISSRDEAEKIINWFKEQKECLVNTNILKQQITDCKVIEITDYHHGELAIGNPEKHLEYLEELMR